MHSMTGGAYIVNSARQAIGDKNHQHEDHADHKDDDCVHVQRREVALSPPKTT